MLAWWTCSDGRGGGGVCAEQRHHSVYIGPSRWLDGDEKNPGRFRVSLCVFFFRWAHQKTLLLSRTRSFRVAGKNDPISLSLFLFARCVFPRWHIGPIERPSPFQRGDIKATAQLLHHQRLSIRCLDELVKWQWKVLIEPISLKVTFYPLWLKLLFKKIFKIKLYYDLRKCFIPK